jgi:hypothetical protein
VVGGATGVFAAVLVMYYVLPSAVRTDAVQVPLTVGAAVAVGFLLGDPDGDARLVPVRAPLACGLGGALCTLVVAFEASRRGPGFVPVVAASAVVLPVLFGALGAVGAVSRGIYGRLAEQVRSGDF